MQLSLLHQNHGKKCYCAVSQCKSGGYQQSGNCSMADVANLPTEAFGVDAQLSLKLIFQYGNYNRKIVINVLYN